MRKFKYFILSWWFCSVRNSMQNFNNYCAYTLGEYEADIDEIAGRRDFIIRRKFKGGIRPYCEFWFLGRWNQIGWIKGGRFEIDIMKVK